VLVMRYGEFSSCAALPTSSSIPTTGRSVLFVLPFPVVGKVLTPIPPMYN
jgi:hypothetical protein